MKFLIEYQYTKDFNEKQIEELFISVKWLSGKSPHKWNVHYIIQVVLFPREMEKANGAYRG